MSEEEWENIIKVGKEMGKFPFTSLTSATGKSKISVRK